MPLRRSGPQALYLERVQDASEAGKELSHGGDAHTCYIASLARCGRGGESSPGNETHDRHFMGHFPGAFISARGEAAGALPAGPPWRRLPGASLPTNNPPRLPHELRSSWRRAPSSQWSTEAVPRRQHDRTASGPSQEPDLGGDRARRARCVAPSPQTDASMRGGRTAHRILSTTRKRAWLLIIRSKASPARSRGNTSFWERTPVSALKSIVSCESWGTPLGQPWTR